MDDSEVAQCKAGDETSHQQSSKAKNFSASDWIFLNGQESKISVPCPYFRRTFCVGSGEIKSAKISASALGLFHLYINEHRVGDQEEFQPGFSEYTKRAYYRTYDVKSMLSKGRNMVGGILGEGFYSGYVAFSRKKNFYGFPPKLLIELVVEFENGEVLRVGTDNIWKASTGPILWSDIYDGEQYDARFEVNGWNTANYDDSKWVQVGSESIDKVGVELTLHPGPPIKKMAEITPISLTEVQTGVYIFDLGQNMVGWARLNALGNSGNTVRLRYAEMLHDDGTLYTRNYRTARSTDEYVFAGGDEPVAVEWEPHFTYHGFRYVELTGFEMMRSRPDITWITGIVLHSDMQTTGYFECSNKLLNKLQENIVWSQKGNFFDIPTDCPQRDERMGWTGDAQIFAPTAAFNMDVKNFFRKWMLDLIDSQKEDGAVPPVAPNVLNGLFNNSMDASAGWADAIIIVPYTMYLHYADKKILEDSYPAMVKWIEYQVRTSEGLCRPWMGFGDWLAVTPSPPDMTGTAYFAYTTSIVVKIAEILGHHEHAVSLANLHQQIKEAFKLKFMDQNDEDLAFQSQTVYLMALAFDLMPDRQLARNRLVQIIEHAGNHLTTGFLGTPLLLPVLTELGEFELVYKLLLQETNPSWLFPVIQGATTMWERWNSYSKIEGFGPSEMNSFNHYAYGAVGDWMYSNILGINLDPQQPGYKTVKISPKPGGGLKWAKGHLYTPYGLVQVSWEFLSNTEQQSSQIFRLKIQLGKQQKGIVNLHYFFDKIGENVEVRISLADSNYNEVSKESEINIFGGQLYNLEIEILNNQFDIVAE